MTYTPMKDVREFHDRFDPSGVDRSREPAIALLEKRRKLIQEEFREVGEAIEDYKKWIFYSDNELDNHGLVGEKREQLAKELADLLYVVYGTAEELSIPLEEIFKVVHQSNMGKLWPDGQVHYNEYGKVIKPPTYTPPDLGPILNERLTD